MERSSHERLPTSGDTTISMSPTAAPVHEPGTLLLGKFRVVDVLGAGGMGTVYRVDHLLMERQFALKCLNKFQAANASWKRFQNEAKAAHILDHPNLLKVSEFGLLESGQPYFLMELVEGSTLSDEIKRLGHLPIDRAVALFIQVAFAISYAHAHKVIHRDLKPSNIMIVPPATEHEQESVKVVDFGLAKLTGIDEFNQQTLTKTGEIFGSPFYMSPEQCSGIPADHRSDIYSLGCVFYETLTSAPPFMGESALSTMMKHQSEKQLPLKEASLGVSYPAALESIICKMLEKEPDKRYQSAETLAGDLIALQRRLNEDKQLISAQGRATTPAQKAHRKSESAAWTKTVSVPKVAAFAAAMYLLGAASAYLYLSSTMQQRNEVPVKVPMPAKSSDTRKYWSEIEGNKKIFYFPDEALGRFMLATGQSVNAIGRVQVPLGIATGLNASPYLFTNPQFLEKFRPDEISVMDIACDNIKSKSFAGLKRFTGLRLLNVSGTAFSDVDLGILTSLKQMQYLNLCATDINCDTLLKYPVVYQLNGLDISNTTNAEHVLARISQFPKLQFLAISTSGLANSDMKNIAKSKSIRILCISTNIITDVGIKELLPLKTLEWLDITRTPVTPKCVETLKQLPKLKTLELGFRTEWTAEQRANFVKELKTSHPDIKVYFQDFGTYDASTLQGFPWNASGLASHSNYKRLMPNDKSIAEPNTFKTPSLTPSQL